MKEIHLKQFALIIIILGTFILLFISDQIKPPFVLLKDLNMSYIEKEIQVQGKIINIIQKENLFILTLDQNKDTIKVVAFTKEFLPLQKGDTITVEGVLKEFQNKLEIETLVIFSE